MPAFDIIEIGAEPAGLAFTRALAGWPILAATDRPVKFCTAERPEARFARQTPSRAAARMPFAWRVISHMLVQRYKGAV